MMYRNKLFPKGHKGKAPFNPNKEQAICDYCGIKREAQVGENVALMVLDWNWFTGAQPETRHICNRCMRQDTKRKDFENRARAVGVTISWNITGLF
jgi:hypothetical protein